MLLIVLKAPLIYTIVCNEMRVAARPVMFQGAEMFWKKSDVPIKEGNALVIRNIG